jgi:hypothetical protein
LNQKIYEDYKCVWQITINLKVSTCKDEVQNLKIKRKNHPKKY